MNNDLRDQIYSSMSLKETDELLGIWQRHDSNEWTDSAFEVVGEILRDRLGEPPSQTFEKHKMSSEFEKGHFPIWCEDCDQQGYIFIDDFESPHFVVCKTCGWETSDVWCPTCGMGGEYIRNIAKRPASWNCPKCKTKYELPIGFYENPIMLFMEEVLPPPVLERIKKGFQTANNPLRILQQVIIGLFIIVVLIAIWLLPMLLVFTPLPWTIPGFIVTLLVFPVWWWLSTKIIKNVRARFTKSTS